ncbi:DUF2199 domain-containing protein [Cellulomonas cellasea]|uniref:DUF2199 domain-containing protein n=1 Tax=Cellulomonas cellasea TaxID=43670 RepID=A0A7W4UG08_9CELL|nr:DUF2199 domain-containing protein [Cellulomonas cellasea]MBB2923474.1 hypothetical protein [Cellulomonas cellasea]
MITSSDGSPPTGFECAGCGRRHEEMPLAFHAPAPAVWTEALAGQPDCELTSDVCVIHGEHFFVRGLVEVPIVGRDERFAWGVWVSLSEENFWRTGDTWDTPGREAAAPMFGWLSTELPTFRESTLNLKTMVHTRPVGIRPLVELEPTEHALAVEQREGLTWDAVTARVSALVHG